MQVVGCFTAAITKKTPFFAKKWPKKAIFWLQTVFLGPEWAVVGPPTLFSGCWTHRNVFCKVSEQVIEFFGAAITKKTAFFASKWPKKRLFLPKTVFLGSEWSVIGLPTLF